MPISGFKVSSGTTLLAQGRLSQAFASQEAVRSVVITFASGQHVTLSNATISRAVPGANGGSTVQITYEQANTSMSSSTPATDDWTQP